MECKKHEEILIFKFKFFWLLPMVHRTPELVDRETVLRQRIEHLKRDRAAICLPMPWSRVEGKMNPEIGHLAELRGGHTTKENTKPPEGKKEKPSLFYELISVRVGAVAFGLCLNWYY